MSTNDVTLNAEQQTAFEGIMDWAETTYSTCSPSERTLGGYAGTGKTTLIAAVMGEAHVCYLLAPTGKAAAVLRSKGLQDARTVHSAVYRLLSEKNGAPQFERYPEGILPGSLVIVDEASMVNAEMAETLRESQAHILWVGDQGQLPPVGDDPGIMANPDFILRNIVRQAEGSPIIEAAHDILSGRKEPRDLESKSEGLSILSVKPRPYGSVSPLVKYAMENEVDQIICAFNQQRKDINEVYRRALGHTDPLEVGDKIICTRNNDELGICNGEIFIVQSLSQGTRRNCVSVVMASTGNEGPCIEADVDVPSLRGYSPKHRPAKGAQLFEYGYAITCHKAQGSEWPHVLVVDGSCQHWDDKRWRYTAVTRAQQALTLFV